MWANMNNGCSVFIMTLQRETAIHEAKENASNSQNLNDLIAIIYIHIIL